MKKKHYITTQFIHKFHNNKYHQSNSILKYHIDVWQQILTLGFDSGSVDRHVRVSGQVFGSQQVLADASSCFRQLGRVQVESLSGLHRKLRASAVSHRQTVRTLNTDSEMKVKSWVTVKSKYCPLIRLKWMNSTFKHKWKTKFHLHTHSKHSFNSHKEA